MAAVKMKAVLVVGLPMAHSGLAYTPGQSAPPLSPLRAANSLTEAHISAFDRDGCIVVRGAFKVYLPQLREAFDDAMREPGPYAEDLANPDRPVGPDSAFFTDLEMCHRFQSFRNVAEESPAAAIAARLCGSKTSRLLYDQMFVKMADNPQAVAASTPWHQDQSYWCVQGDQVTSIFIALDDTPEDQCLQYEQGSHRRLETMHQPVHFASGTPYESDDPLPTLEPPSPQNLMAWTLNAGDCVVFHGKVVHGGRGSFGRALSIRYLGDDVRVAELPRGQGAIPTAWMGSGLPEGVVDGMALDDPAVGDAFPLVWTDPLFGTRGTTPVSVQEWSKGVAVNEEKLDVLPS